MDGCKHSKSPWPAGFTNPEKLPFASHKDEPAQNFPWLKGSHNQLTPSEESSQWYILKNKFYYLVIKPEQCGCASAGWVFWNRFCFQVKYVFSFYCFPSVNEVGGKRMNWLLKVQLIIFYNKFKSLKNKHLLIWKGVGKSVSYTQTPSVLAMLSLLIAAQDSTSSSQVFKFLKSLQKKLVCNGHTLQEERPIMAFHWLYLAFICELNGCTWRWEFSSHSSIWL